MKDINKYILSYYKDCSVVSYDDNWNFFAYLKIMFEVKCHWFSLANWLFCPSFYFKKYTLFWSNLIELNWYFQPFLLLALIKIFFMYHEFHFNHNSKKNVHVTYDFPAILFFCILLLGFLSTLLDLTLARRWLIWLFVPWLNS